MTPFEIFAAVDGALLIFFLLIVRFDSEDVGPDHPDFEDR